MRELLLQRGALVPMEEIAAAAGVGVGTLYRHFPDRYALLKGVAIQNMSRVVGEVESAQAEEPDGWHCIARVVSRIHELRLGDPVPVVLPQLIERARLDPEFQNTRRTAASALGTILERAQAEGAVRQDLTVADLLTLATARPQPAAVFGEAAAGRLQERHLRIVLDGLRPHTDPLPCAVDDAEIEAHFSGTPSA